jgi:hypothetical protein
MPERCDLRVDWVPDSGQQRLGLCAAPISDYAGIMDALRIECREVLFLYVDFTGDVIALLSGAVSSHATGDVASIPLSVTFARGHVKHDRLVKNGVAATPRWAAANM